MVNNQPFLLHTENANSAFYKGLNYLLSRPLNTTTKTMTKIILWPFYALTDTLS